MDKFCTLLCKISLPVLLVFLTACSNSEIKYKEPTNLLFQNSNQKGTISIHIQRDNKLCSDDTIYKQNCPINLYINDFKAGTYYIENAATYYLEPGVHNLKAKNCIDKCLSDKLNININNSNKDQTFILSVDEEGKPLIIPSQYDFSLKNKI
ncbi:hypothetical protein [Acinetobacter radioresistens]|uniref:hypothetical protein n=1 Tax=Acinetobacter radioresistens TaxID=40216 RepID=UPI0009461F8C|nr:hypothetical protein [Acinetobacter radioresistens]